MARRLVLHRVGKEGAPMTTASRIINAPRRTIYRAFLDPEAVVAWLPPDGMMGRIDEFDARDGGSYRMSLSYVEPDHAVRGKTSEHTDTVRGRFVELVPDERIVQQAEFESEDPAFAGSMTIIWTLADVAEGTEVTVRCENAPEGIQPRDHEAGFRSTLQNLAAFTE
jgi:uncharacterized protein YndB with AHSA1/START domain